MALEECLLGLSSKSVEGCHYEVRKPEGALGSASLFLRFCGFLCSSGGSGHLCVRFFDFLVVVLG